MQYFFQYKDTSSNNEWSEWREGSFNENTGQITIDWDMNVDTNQKNRKSNVKNLVFRCVKISEQNETSYFWVTRRDKGSKNRNFIYLIHIDSNLSFYFNNAIKSQDEAQRMDDDNADSFKASFQNFLNPQNKKTEFNSNSSIRPPDFSQRVQLINEETEFTLLNKKFGQYLTLLTDKIKAYNDSNQKNDADKIHSFLSTKTDKYYDDSATTEEKNNIIKELETYYKSLDIPREPQKNLIENPIENNKEVQKNTTWLEAMLHFIQQLMAYLEACLSATVEYVSSFCRM